MAVVMGNAAILMDWQHHVTKDSDKMVLLPTCVTRFQFARLSLLTLPAVSSLSTVA